MKRGLPIPTVLSQPCDQLNILNGYHDQTNFTSIVFILLNNSSSSGKFDHVNVHLFFIVLNVSVNLSLNVESFLIMDSWI